MQEENKGEFKNAGVEDIYTKWELSSPMGGAKIVYYVNKQNEIRRVVALSPDGQQIYNQDVVELDLNPKFSDSDFAAPAGYAIQDTSNPESLVPKTPPAPEAAPAAPAPPEPSEPAAPPAEGGENK